MRGSLSFNSRFTFEMYMVTEKRNVQISSLKNEQKYHSHPQSSTLILELVISKTSGRK